ncbi:hypothetical protein BCR39DRAFT_590008 [Naematelia encephala]|uniref:Uncharacterized protein n=1 Tax=Naematelia encephala TaxID=71784 RepID=A0A1Y2ATW4_9TREE|nr:hypothetical protein BCR39DRAFT_590008 [Naematelia encephala]
MVYVCRYVTVDQKFGHPSITMLSSLQPEIWRIIVEHLVRPVPSPSEACSWHELHQNDLAAIMRVNTTMYILAAPLLYDSPTIWDLSRFLYRSPNPSPIQPTKADLLKRVRSLTFSNTEHLTAPVDDDELPIVGQMILRRTLEALSCSSTAPAIIPNIDRIEVRAPPDEASTWWRAFNSWMMDTDIDPLPMTQRAFAALVQALSPRTLETYGSPTGPLVYLCRSTSGRAWSFPAHSMQSIGSRAGPTLISHIPQLNPHIRIVKGTTNRFFVQPAGNRQAVDSFVAELMKSLASAELEKGAVAKVEVVGACWPGAIEDGIDKAEKAEVEEEELEKARGLLDKVLRGEAKDRVRLYKRFEVLAS